MRTKLWFGLIVMSMITICYASSGYIPISPATHYLVPDRIRNTPAIDPDEYGSGIRFYITTFGLDNYSTINRAPLPKSGELVRFGIENSDTVIQFSNTIWEKMTEPQFNMPGTQSPNCYTTDDYDDILGYFHNELMYTDGVSRTEGFMRYESGSGFWASPVLIKGNGAKTLILLTKSGCLMSVNVNSEVSVVNWKVSLRDDERAHPESFKFEFMATPLVIGDKIYIPGIKRLHIIEDIFGTNPIHVSTPCPNLDVDDYFELPLVEGTNPDNSLYAISRKGKAFKITWPNITELSIGANQSSTPPFVSADGHVYFTSLNNAGSVISYIDQDNRDLESDSNSPHQITMGDQNYMFKSCILSDYGKNKYLFTDTDIVRISEVYDYNSITGTDPISYTQVQSEWAYPTVVTHGAKRFPGNHSMLAYHNSTLQTMIYTIANNNGMAYSSDYLNYYPNYPIGNDLYNISSKSIQMSYYCHQSRFGNNSDSAYNSISHSVSGHLTWGGIASYVSLSNYYNSIFGDENGCVTTYPSRIQSESVNFSPIIESISSITPEMGYSKFMQNQANHPEKNEVESCEIYLLGCDFPNGDVTYINSYPRQSQLVTYPNLVNPLLKTQICNILPNREYQIAFRKEATSQQMIVYDKVEISQSENRILLMANQDADIVGDITWDFTALNQLGLVPHYRNVSISTDNHLTLNNSQVIIDNLYLGLNSHLTLQDYANLSVGVMECKSPNGTAIVDLSGTKQGRLAVRSNFDNALVNNVGGNILFKGQNLTFPNYRINTFLNKPGCSVTFQSYNQAYTSNNASVSIIDFQNKGIVNVNDCVSLDLVFRNYEPEENGIVNINTTNQSFGHLIWNIHEGWISSPFQIGSSTITNPQRAKFTVNGTTCLIRSYLSSSPSTYHVWGIVSVLGSGTLNITGNSTLLFESGSKLELNGGNDQNKDGAQLSVTLDNTYGAGVVKFSSSGVSISGYKPSNVNHRGDRIITDDYGMIEGIGQNPRKLTNINVTSINPNSLRWDGIYINTTNTDGHDFELESTNQSKVSDINKFNVKYPGSSPIISGIEFVNCTYGVYSTTNEVLQSPRNIGISNCSFKDCSYGIYLEDSSSTTTPNINACITAEISNCNFGNTNAINGFNFAGIALHRALNVEVTGCNFYRNAYGIMCIQSSILVGGSYNPNTGIPEEGPRCYFYNNEKAGINFEQSPSTVSKSLIYHNVFSGDFSTQSSTSGIGVWANESIIDVIGNDFINLGWHGMLVNSYSWLPNPNQPNHHGFAVNQFQDNNGCELIGDAVSLSSSRGGLNVFNDAQYTETGFVPSDPLNNFDSWDKYILASLANDAISRATNMTGNIFGQSPPNNVERYYPDCNAFCFDPVIPTTLYEIVTLGMNQFYQGLFDESIQSMKEAVETYPDSTLTLLAIDYLYLATRASTEDYESLRTYLDLKIPYDAIESYLKKEDIKTKCYIKEEDYLTAISRLQLILDNPMTVADSLFALIDQAFCYMNLALAGDKALPNISVKTSNFTSYMEFLAGLNTDTHVQTTDDQQIPHVLSLYSNFPNPFNPTTTIRFALPHEGNVVLTIYNVKGQKVTQLVNEKMLAGNHSIVWNGTDSNGRSVCSGLYFARIEHGSSHRIQKMMLLK